MKSSLSALLKLHFIMSSCLAGLWSPERRLSHKICYLPRAVEMSLSVETCKCVRAELARPSLTQCCVKLELLPSWVQALWAAKCTVLALEYKKLPEAV